MTFIKSLFQTILVLVIGAGVIWFTAWTINKYKKPEVIEKEKITEIKTEVKLSIPECPRSFEAYQDLIKGGQSFKLLTNANSYASGGKFINPLNITVNRTGEIACGYLYVRAKKDSGALDEKTESIYINPGGFDKSIGIGGFGGHLLRSRTAPISEVNKITNTTEVLFELNAIPYLPNVPYDPNSQNYKIADWSKLLDVLNQTNFKIALSVENPSATIEEIVIAYKCWNPETGRETQDCQLSK